MKLLCVIPAYWPAFQLGGPIFSVYNLNKTLAKKGVDVSVYTTNVGLDSDVLVNQEVEIEGVKLTYFTFSNLFEYLGTTGWQFSLPLTRALKKNLKLFDIIYIVAIWNYPIAITAHYCKHYQKPYVISPRGLLYPYATEKKSWKKWPYYQFIIKKALTGAAAIHYTTRDESQKCHLALGLNNPTLIIPNGIDLSEFRNLPEREKLRQRYPVLKDKKVILFLGRINWKKGLDILVKAYSALVKDKDSVHLLIVGGDEGGYIRKVKRWVSDYGIEQRVTFTGILTGNEKLEAYAGSDIFVLPSYSENFGIAAVEAMACGIPVIVTDRVGIFKEIKENKAGIVVTPEAEALYKGINLLLDNPKLGIEMSANGRMFVEGHYDINKVAEMMIEAYDGLIKNDYL